VTSSISRADQHWGASRSEVLNNTRVARLLLLFRLLPLSSGARETDLERLQLLMPAIVTEVHNLLFDEVIFKLLGRVRLAEPSLDELPGLLQQCGAGLPSGEPGGSGSTSSSTSNTDAAEPEALSTIVLLRHVNADRVLRLLRDLESELPHTAVPRDAVGTRDNGPRGGRWVLCSHVGSLLLTVSQPGCCDCPHKLQA
jgi:hypothetical protein